jgi:hypothetical protein
MRARIGVTRDRAVSLGDQIRIVFRQQGLLTASHLSFVRRLDFECRRAMPDSLAIDSRDGGYVGGVSGANANLGHAPQ